MSSQLVLAASGVVWACNLMGGKHPPVEYCLGLLIKRLIEVLPSRLLLVNILLFVQVEFLKNASCKTLCKDIPMTEDAKIQLQRLVRDKYMFQV